MISISIEARQLCTGTPHATASNDARSIAETDSPFAGRGNEGAWIDQQFWGAVVNTLIVTVSVVPISITFGVLGGYALSPSNFRYTFWILIIALILRALPHITLVSDYLLPIFKLSVWCYLPTPDCQRPDRRRG